MENKEVTVDLQQFPEEAKKKEIKSIYELILKTVDLDKNPDKAKSACLMIHADSRISERVTMFASGNPKVSQRLLINAIKTLVKEGTGKKDEQNKLLIMLAFDILVDVDLDKLNIPKELKKEIVRSITALGLLSLT